LHLVSAHPPCSRKGPLLPAFGPKCPTRVKRETTNSRFSFRGDFAKFSVVPDRPTDRPKSCSLLLPPPCRLLLSVRPFVNNGPGQGLGDSGPRRSQAVRGRLFTIGKELAGGPQRNACQRLLILPHAIDGPWPQVAGRAVRGSGPKAKPSTCIGPSSTYRVGTALRHYRYLPIHRGCYATATYPPERYRRRSVAEQQL
jgi:hypothetical protein